MLVCDSNEPSCMKQDCERCLLHADVLEFLKRAISDDREAININQWQKGKLVNNIYTKDELCDLLLALIQKYTSHVYNIKRQHQAMQKDKEDLGPGDVILQMDFAENYAVKHQNEVMAAHWEPSKGVTIFLHVSLIIETKKMTSSIKLLRLYRTP